jgi:hypothetical protein
VTGLSVAVMVVGTICPPAVQADPSAKIQAINACRAELGKNAKYLDVRACVNRKMKGE